MKALKSIFCACALALAFPAGAFDSRMWLAERNDDSDMVRLKAAFADCLSKLVQPAVDVVFPLESFPDGRIKSRLKAKRAQLFLDTGFIWGEGIRVEEYDASGKVKGSIEAENCVVDRTRHTGWVEGAATLHYGDTTVRGRGVYFSFDREFVKIFSHSEIRSRGLKTDVRSVL